MGKAQKTHNPAAFVMTETCLHIYADDHLRQALATGSTGMVAQLRQAVEAMGWQVLVLPQQDDWLAPARPGLHLVINRPVLSPNMLVLRRCHLDPFWRIETTNDRWNWQIASEKFPGLAAQPPARQFTRYWRGRLFANHAIGDDGFVFVPLQGRLTERRSFQSHSPIDMLRRLAAHWPTRRIVATLHPAEVYDAPQRAALQSVLQDHGTISLSEQPSLTLLARCGLVATQNSAMAIKGLFAEKPALLFGKIDFHHEMASVPRDGEDIALHMAAQAKKRDYSAYLHWYFKQNALNAWAADVQSAIRDRLAQLGWPK